MEGLETAEATTHSGASLPSASALASETPASLHDPLSHPQLIGVSLKKESVGSEGALEALEPLVRPEAAQEEECQTSPKVASRLPIFEGVRK